MFSDLHSKGEMGNLQEVFRVATKWELYIGIPFCLVFCFAPTEMLTVLYGADYAGGATALVILVLGQLVNVATGSTGALLSMTGHQRSWMVLSSLALVLNIVLCVLLIPRFGFVGAAAGTSISVSILNIVGVIVARLSLGVWPYDSRYLKGILATLCALLVLGVFRFSFHGSAALFLGISICLAVFTFFGLLMLQGFDTEDKDLLQLVRLRILRGRS
jgi:O-antigen/teichoic acid export membrane protein